MVRIPTTNGSFCIDTTEVSQADYGEFLAAKGDNLMGQGEMCSFFHDWAPPLPDPIHGGGCQPLGWDAKKKTGASDLPMGCTHWCSAQAYCEWAGKRLCGKVGGGQLAKEELKSATLSEMVYTCSQGGKTEFPYGDKLDKTACAVEEGQVDTQEKKKLGTSACHGQTTPYSEVYDLVGNVDEWEGGAAYLPDGDSGDSRWFYPFLASPVSAPLEKSALNCSANGYYGGPSVLGNMGIRCCAD